MKKLLSMILMIAMLMPISVYSCDETNAAVLPNVDAATDMCGYVWVAVQSSTHCLYGMLSPAEKVSIYQAQTDTGRVRGISAQGVIRTKGEMRYMVISESVCGLTKVQASVHISAEYLAIVTEIVRRNLGEDAEVTAANIVACTIRRTQSTVTHMMVGRNVSKVAIGSVLFHGAEMAATLYIADWDGDGQLDLVLSVHPGPSTKATPAPTATPKPGKPPKPSKPTATPKPSDPQCLKIMIQVNIERISIHDVNIDSIFKPCGGQVEGC